MEDLLWTSWFVSMTPDLTSLVMLQYTVQTKYPQLQQVAVLKLNKSKN